MKISEAIRKGSQEGKQLIGVYISERGDSCSVGAAILGVRPNCRATNLNTLLVIFETAFGLDFTEYECLCYHNCRSTICSIMIHMNDYHKRSREYIADYLESKGF